MVVNLGANLSRNGYKVLLIDCDAQGNLQNQFNIKTGKSLSDLLLTGEVEIASVRPRLDIINSGKQDLVAAEMALYGKTYREKIMHERCQSISDYDFIFCDLSPTITLVNTMALFYCDYLLIPVSMSFYSLTGAHQIIAAAEEISSLSQIELAGLVLNMVDQRTNLAKMVESAVKEKWGEKVFDTVIRKNVAIEEAPTQRKTIFEHAPGSIGAQDFEILTEEFLKRFS